MALKSSTGSTGLAVLALLLVILGVALLLQNLGLLHWGVWGTLWRFWPVVLIILGIYLILGRTRPGLAASISIGVIVVAFALSWSLGGTSGSGRTISGTFSEPLSSLERGQVSIEFGAGQLTLDSLPESSPSLVEGEFQHQGLAQGLKQEFQRQGGLGKLALHTPVGPPRFLGDFRQTWQVHLTRRIPLELTIKAGASSAQLDLSQLRVSELRLDIGATKATLKLPRVVLGSLPVFVKAGAADLAIEVPQGMAARLKTGSGPASLKVDEGRFPRSGEYYVSSGFAQAVNRIDLDISGGLARIEIR